MKNNIKFKGWWWKKFISKHRREKKLMSDLVDNNKELQKELPNIIFEHARCGYGYRYKKSANKTNK